MDSNNEKQKNNTPILVTILSLILIGGALYLILGQEKDTTNIHLEASPPSGENIQNGVENHLEARPPSREDIPEGWSEYVNESFGFSLFYPEELSAQEYDEGGGAGTLIFQNIESVQGLQIFIVPYDGETITDERFLRDVPSGERENVQRTTIGGIEAVVFDSRNALLGETKEVWFIHGGYLYEITTLRNTGEWLSDILNTWEFM